MSKLANFFLYACAILLGLAGFFACTTTRQADPPDPLTPVVAVDTLGAPADTLARMLVVPHRTAVDRVLGRQAAPRTTNSIGRVGKKATIYYAPAIISAKKATVAASPGAAASSGKKAGPLLQADSGATLNYAASKQQAAAGEGNHLTAPAPPRKSLLATLLPVAGIVGGVGLVYWLVLGGGVTSVGLLLAWVRRKTTNQT